MSRRRKRRRDAPERSKDWVYVPELARVLGRSERVAERAMRAILDAYGADAVGKVSRRGKPMWRARRKDVERYLVERRTTLDERFAIVFQRLAELEERVREQEQRLNALALRRPID